MVQINFWHIFTAVNEEPTMENIDQSQRKEFGEGFQQPFSKSVNILIEANKKFIFVLYNMPRSF